jgi:group I intron endonuclease
MTALSEDDLLFPAPLLMEYHPNVGGVYIILNLVNRHLYVGSTINLRKRIVLHRHKLRKNKHHSPHLQNAWNLYGEEAFKFGVLLISDDKRYRLAVEQTLLDVHPREMLYNVARFATSSAGVRRSEETKAKIREALKDPARLAHIRRLGKSPKSEEQRILMSIAARRRPPVSEETRVKMQRSSAQRWARPEERAKISAARRRGA